MSVGVDDAVLTQVQNDLYQQFRSRSTWVTSEETMVVHNAITSMQHALSLLASRNDLGNQQELLITRRFMGLYYELMMINMSPGTSDELRRMVSTLTNHITIIIGLWSFVELSKSGVLND